MGFDVYERVLVCEETMPVGREKERERERVVNMTVTGVDILLEIESEVWEAI